MTQIDSDFNHIIWCPPRSCFMENPSLWIMIEIGVLDLNVKNEENIAMKLWLIPAFHIWGLGKDELGCLAWSRDLPPSDLPRLGGPPNPPPPGGPRFPPPLPRPPLGALNWSWRRASGTGIPEFSRRPIRAFACFEFLSVMSLNVF